MNLHNLSLNRKLLYFNVANALISPFELQKLSSVMEFHAIYLVWQMNDTRQDKTNQCETRNLVTKYKYMHAMQTKALG